MGRRVDSRVQVERALREWLHTHHGVLGRREALQLGATDGIIRSKLAGDEWARIRQGVYRDTAAPRTPYQELRAACVSTLGPAIASHSSAAWLWALQRRPPAKPEVTVDGSHHHGRRGPGITVHQSRDLVWSRTVTREAIPVTDPLRTLVDLGASVGPDTLAAAVDAGLASRLVTIDGLLAEAARLRRAGRPGPGPLVRLLTVRGLAGVPHPSVLERKTLALIDRGRLPLPEVEFRTGADGEYRLDFAFPAVKLAIEVDGYVWHFTPEHLQRDHARRNQLQRQGWMVLVYTWRDIVAEPARVAREIASSCQRLDAGRG